MIFSSYYAKRLIPNKALIWYTIQRNILLYSPRAKESLEVLASAELFRKMNVSPAVTTLLVVRHSPKSPADTPRREATGKLPN